MLGDQRADSHRARSLLYRSTSGSSWSSPGAGLNSRSMFRHPVFHSSDKTIKPSCWNSLKGKVWEDRVLGSDRWELRQSNNLPSRVVLIKICSLTISLSPLLFKFTFSLLSQPLSAGSQRPYSIQRPQGDTQPQCPAQPSAASGKLKTAHLVVLQTLTWRKWRRHQVSSIPWPSTNWGRKAVTIIPVASWNKTSLWGKTKSFED